MPVVSVAGIRLTSTDCFVAWERQRHHRRSDAGVALQTREASEVERKFVRTARHHGEDARHEVRVFHTVRVIAEQHQQQLQVIEVQRQERHALDHQHRQQLAVGAHQRRTHEVLRLGDGNIFAFQVRDAHRADGVGDQFVVWRKREIVAHARRRLGTDLAIEYREQRCNFDLANLGDKFKQTVRARQMAQWRALRLVRILACALSQHRQAPQLGNRIAQRGRPGQQILFEPLVRQAHQIVAVGDRHEAVVQIVVDG
jgi:hypothetical protein